MRLALQNVMEEYACQGESFYVDVFYGIRRENGFLEVNGWVIYKTYPVAVSLTNKQSAP